VYLVNTGTTLIVSCAILIGTPGCGALTKKQAAYQLANLDSMKTMERLRTNANKSVQLTALGATVQVNYVRAGDVYSKTKLVLIHGYPDSLLTWADILPSLQEFDVYAIDLPGQGLTKSKSLSKEHLLPRAQAEFVWRFIDEVVLNRRTQRACKGAGSTTTQERVILVGHSFGGLVACAAVDIRDEIDGLVLISSEGVVREGHHYLPSERLLREGFLGWLSGAFPCAAFHVLTHGGWHQITEDQYVELSCGKVAPRLQHVHEYSTLARVPSNYHTNRTLVRRNSAKDAVNFARVGGRKGDRTLLIWGTEDYLFPLHGSDRMPGHGEIFRCWFRGCQFETIDGAGHLPHREEPGAVSEALLRFLHGRAVAAPQRMQRTLPPRISTASVSGRPDQIRACERAVP